MLTENTYLLRLPLLLAGDAVLPPTTWHLAALSVVLNVVGWLLVWRFVREAVAESTGRPLQVPHEIVAVATSVSVFVISESMRLVNSGLTTRNLETGLYLQALWVVWLCWSGRILLDTRRAALISIAVILLGLNDPLFIYSIATPVVAVVALDLLASATFADRRPPIWRRPLLAGVAIGVVGWWVIRSGLHLVSVQQRGSGVSVASLRTLPDRLENLAQVASLASGFDRIDSGRTWQQATAVLFGAAIVAVVVGLVRHRRTVSTIVWLALAWLALLCGLFLATTAGTELSGYRYVSVGFGAVSAAAAVVATRSRLGSAIAVGVALIAVVGAVVDHVTEWGDNQNLARAELADTIDDLARDGHVVGYAGYWSAPIISFLGRSDTEVLPVRCDAAGRTVPFEWITDLGRFSRTAGARPSFLIIDHTSEATMCSTGQLVDQYGRPDDIVRVPSSDDYEVWVWDPGDR